MIITLLWLMATMTQSAPPPGSPGPGVPLALAESRASRVSALRYDLRFTVPSSASEPLAGRAVIRFSLRDADAPLALDGYITDISVEREVHPDLANAAITAVREWMYTQTLLNCQPVSVGMTITVNFKAASPTAAKP